MFDPATCSLVVPRPNEPNVLLPLRKIYEAEGRIKEIAFVNEHKAPELLAVFNISYLDLNDHITRCELLLHEATKAANTRRSIVILDEVPKILAAKNLGTARNPGGSEDQRKAVLDCDEEYLKHTDRVAQIKCIIELLEGKRKSIEMAYTSVKKILGGEPTWKTNTLGNRSPNLSAALGQGPIIGEGDAKEINPNSPRSRFGTAK